MIVQKSSKGAGDIVMKLVLNIPSKGESFSDFFVSLQCLLIICNQFLIATQG